jgi:hypothetical protein
VKATAVKATTVKATAVKATVVYYYEVRISNSIFSLKNVVKTSLVCDGKERIRAIEIIVW